MIDPKTHVRIARPSRDLDAAERFYVAGLQMTVLYKAAGGPGEHDLVMLGWPEASWHLELLGGRELTVRPTPSTEDLLVLYLDRPADASLVDRLVAAGGTRVSQGQYWDRWGVTVADPDGYRLVLSERSWSNTPSQPAPSGSPLVP